MSDTKKIMDPQSGNMVDPSAGQGPGYNPISTLKNPDHIADLKAHNVLGKEFNEDGTHKKVAAPAVEPSKEEGKPSGE